MELRNVKIGDVLFWESLGNQSRFLVIETAPYSATVERIWSNFTKTGEIFLMDVDDTWTGLRIDREYMFCKLIDKYYNI